MAAANAPSPLATDYVGAARLLTVSPRSIERLVASGELPHAKIGRRVVIAIADIEAFLLSRRTVGHATLSIAEDAA